MPAGDVIVRGFTSLREANRKAHIARNVHKAGWGSDAVAALSRQASGASHMNDNVRCIDIKDTVVGFVNVREIDEAVYGRLCAPALSLRGTYTANSKSVKTVKHQAGTERRILAVNLDDGHIVLYKYKKKRHTREVHDDANESMQFYADSLFSVNNGKAPVTANNMVVCRATNACHEMGRAKFFLRIRNSYTKSGMYVDRHYVVVVDRTAEHQPLLKWMEAQAH